MAEFGKAAQVGLMVIALGGAAVFGFRFVSPKTGTQGGYTVHAYLPDVMGVAPHSRVSIQGIQSGVAAARFSAEADGSIAFGDRVELARAEPAGPYPLGVTRLSPDWLFVSWSDGDSPAFRLRGRFVRLP